MLSLNIKADYFPDVLKNPFNNELVKWVTIEWSVYSNEWQGSIRFKNGDTGGRQDFKDIDLVSIIQRMEIFLKNLDQ